MNTSPNNPPAGGAVSPPSTPSQPPEQRRSWITPVLITVGVIVLLFAIVGAALSGTRLLSQGEEVKTASADGVEALNISVSAGEFTLEFGDVDETTLETSGDTGWTLERRGETFEVRPPNRWFSGWFTGWLGDANQVSLTLPASLETVELDAELRLSAGSLSAEAGTYGDLEVRVSAGEASVAGSARTVDTNVSSNVSAGSFDHKLQTAPNSTRFIDVNVSAGSATVGTGN